MNIIPPAKNEILQHVGGGDKFFLLTNTPEPRVIFVEQCRTEYIWQEPRTYCETVPIVQNR